MSTRQKILFPFLSILFLGAAFEYSGAAAPKLRIAATTPDLADITRRIGGDLVSVDGLARGTEDIHQIVMRPSFVSKLNRADAVVYLGLTLEHSFLPGLLEVASNSRMRSDVVRTCLGSGCIDCSKDINILERPETLSRAEGELHPQGNPHYNLGPDNGPMIARNIAEGLAGVAPEHRAEFEKNLKAFQAELKDKLSQWHGLVSPLKGVKAVSYHKDVAYLGRFTGIDFVATVELKPGVAPTPTHLAQLVKKMKDENIKLIVREQHFEAKTCEWLAQQTGARIAVIGVMGNAFPDADTFINFSQHNLKALAAAVK